MDNIVMIINITDLRILSQEMRQRLEIVGWELEGRYTLRKKGSFAVPQVEPLKMKSTPEFNIF